METNSCSLILDKTNKELNLKGTNELPVAVYNDDLKAEPVPYHWHDEIELIVVVSGKMELVVEGEKFVFSAGEGIFINSGRLHSCVNFDETNCFLKSFVLHSKFIYGDLTSILYQNYLHPLINESSAGFVILTAEMCDILLSAYDIFVERPFAFEFSVREHLTKIIMTIIKTTENDKVPFNAKKTRQLNRCKLMLSFIHTNYGEDITLFDIANSANIKESECLRCFKTVLNTSPIKYLKTYRIERSAFALKTSVQPIIDIALSCGFVEMSYFSKSFKEQYKMTPSEYRKLEQT